MMKKIAKLLAVLPGVIFLVAGLRWLTEPAMAAQMFGMTLLDGIGRSSQIGDMAAYLIGGSIMIFAGLITEKRTWLYAAAMVVALTAMFRVMARLLHDAALATKMIVPEIIFAALILFAASRLPKEQ